MCRLFSISELYTAFDIYIPVKSTVFISRGNFSVDNAGLGDFIGEVFESTTRFESNFPSKNIQTTFESKMLEISYLFQLNYNAEKTFSLN